MNEHPPSNASNESTDPHGSVGTPQQPGALDRFFAWLRSIGIVRGNDRWFAGVAGGIAARAGIDPLIVRGVFVVLAILGGSGILLYLASWLLLPDTSGRIHFEDVLRGRASTGVIVAFIVLCILPFVPLLLGWVPGFFSIAFWDVWGFLPDWLVLTLGIIWWALVVPALIIWFIVWVAGGGLGRVSGAREPGQGSASPASGSPSAPGFTPAAEADSASAASPTNDDWGERFSQKAEAWGEKVEAKSNEWAQRAEQHYDARRLGASQLLITLALALLAGGAAAGWALSASFDRADTITAGLIASVTVLGISVIVAGIRGRYTGWVGFLAFLGVVALILAPISTVMPERTDFAPFGNSTIRVSDGSPDQGVVTLAGNTTLDLSALDRTAESGDLELWLGFGNVTVLLPDSHPTRVTVHFTAGNLHDKRLPEGEQRQGGIFVTRTIESGTADPRGVEITEVTVRLFGGNVFVEGGEAASASEASLLERSRQLAQLEQEREREQQARQAEIDELRERLTELEATS